MRSIRHRDSVCRQSPQRLPVHFEIAKSMAIPIEVAATCNDWRRMASFVTNPFGGRILNLLGSSSAGQ
jgi:hypothetical protein